MKLNRSYLLICLMGIMMLGNIAAFAQRPPRKAPPPPKRAVTKKIVANKIHSRKAIRRTAIVIHHAQKAVQVNKNYTGDLSRAVAHQRFARKLHMKGLYVRSVRHARIARMYARKAIQANKGAEIAEANLTPEEEELLADSPSEQVLIEELAREEAQPVIDDQKFSNEASDIDIGEDE